MGLTANYDALIQKLDAFTRKYYLNQIIRGSLITLGIVLGVYLLYSLLESQFYFSGTTRKILLISFILISVGSLFKLVLQPLASYFKLGKVISYEQAARIIGKHFQPVEDKLLNILQLKNQTIQSHVSPDLLMAGIEQKTKEIELVPFKSAIDLSGNRKYLRYALPPLFLLLFILVSAPSLLRDSTHRLIHTNQVFEKAAPFHFRLAPDQKLKVVQYDDFNLSVSTEGSMIPAEVFIEIDHYAYRMRRDEANVFSYTFKNVQNNTPFRIYAGPVSGDALMLEVIKKPGIVDFGVELDYPSYTGKKDESLRNIGDLVVPEGTVITWDIQTAQTKHLDLQFSNTSSPVSGDRRAENQFVLKSRANEEGQYVIFLHHELLPVPDSVKYSLRIIPDRYPGIRVESFTDSLEKNLVYFAGSADDDYGVKELNFEYEILDPSGKVLVKEVKALEIPHPTQFSYTHVFDIEKLGLEAGQSVQYFFEAKDNDGINGSKSSRTPVMQFRKPTAEEYDKKEAENNEQIRAGLEKSLKEAQKLQQDMKKLREKLMQEKKAEWQDKKELEKLIDRHHQMQQDVQQSLEKFQENLENQKEHTQPSEEMQEKQERIKKLMEELNSPEMQEMMKKLQEMMKDVEKEGAMDMMEQMEMNDDQLEKQLDRMLELYKTMEVEMEIEQAVEKLEKLAEEQDKLSKETEQEAKPTEQLQAEQEKLNEKMDQIEKDVQQLMEKNEKLEKPKDLNGSQEQMDKIQQDMKQSGEQMEQKQNNNASKSQKNASQRMKDMASQMASQMQSGDMEQMQEDMKMLRQLLENLVTLSFEQEDLISNFRTAEINTPHYVSLVQEQFKIQQDFKVVEDTLHALSKRVSQIESFVTEKVTDIKLNLKRSIQQLEERNRVISADHQQRTMTYLNDLALMLSEVMNQMQQQMANKMPGSQMCNKPGGKSSGQQGSPMNMISQGQQQLNQEMEQLLKQMRDGKSGKMSKEFAEMAAKQAALRKALKDIAKEKKEQGKGDPELDRIGDEMNKIEIDLVNKRLNQETLKRQKDISTRLLEAERSERQRDQDMRRQAETAREQKRSMPPALEKYIRQREAEIEMYKTVSPDLKPYYQFLVDEYYQSLKKSN